MTDSSLQLNQRVRKTPMELPKGKNPQFYNGATSSMADSSVGASALFFLDVTALTILGYLGLVFSAGLSNLEVFSRFGATVFAFVAG